MGRYVVVDETDMLILGGPYVWDGVCEWTPPAAGQLMLESVALGAGYAYPPAPEDGGQEGGEQ
jgi:hypothetical protein